MGRCCILSILRIFSDGLWLSQGDRDFIAIWHSSRRRTVNRIIDKVDGLQTNARFFWNGKNHKATAKQRTSKLKNGIESSNRTQATLVEDECSHHCHTCYLAYKCTYDNFIFFCGTWQRLLLTPPIWAGKLKKTIPNQWQHRFLLPNIKIRLTCLIHRSNE